MKRREFLKLGGAGVVGANVAGAIPATARSLDGAQDTAMSQMQMGQSPAPAPTTKADITLNIAPIALELVPNRIISTIGYNGTSPGPILRMKEGVPVTVDVINDTDTTELVHWHGMLIPPDVDGSDEEGTPGIPPSGRRRYQFTPKPAGTRWYHTHAMAPGDLHRSTYTGQFGFVMVEGASNPGRYDQEVFLALRDWEPFYSNAAMDTDEMGQTGPQPERPAVLDTRPNGLEVTSLMYSINDKALGAGQPIRVKQGDRVLMHLLNASAIENRVVALPGHQFQVFALDGNPVPTPHPVEILFIGPGERVDAYVDMNHPGVWILGAPEDDIRNAGLGVVIEYADQHGEPQWIPPKSLVWDYTVFGRAGTQPAPDQTIDMVFEKIPSGAGKFNLFHVNGKPYPHEKEFVLKRGARYRLVFHNRTDDSHPLHMHRHLWELVDINGKPTAGIMKDTVIVPFYGRATVDLIADQPGLTLFHCHIQQHMDFGFKALFSYE